MRNYLRRYVYIKKRDKRSAAQTLHRRYPGDRFGRENERGRAVSQ